MKRLLFITSSILPFSFSLQCAGAVDINLVAPMKDFAIYEPEDPPPSGIPQIYSATGAVQQWAVAQWNIPGGKLSPFVTKPSPRGSVVTSRADEAAVTITRDESRGIIIDLAQDGAASPCLIGSQPRETDLFISTNGKLGMNPSAEKISLADVDGLNATVTVAARFGPAKTNKGCSVNEVSAIIGIVLNTAPPAAPQAILYQLAVDRHCGFEPPARLRFCKTLRPEPVFYSLKNPFGADDDFLLLDKVPLDRRGSPLSVDILPRLLRVLRTGPSALDRDSSHWRIAGVYLGSVSYGDVTAQTSWTDFKLIASTK